jgi:thiol-disulfide isomerase/thioredoxin
MVPRRVPSAGAALVALAALLVVVPAGCSARHDAASVPAAAPADTAGPPIVRASAERMLALAAAPGADATVLNVWASWCGPCREEFPAMLAVMREHPRARLLLVSADFDAQVGDARRFLSQQGVTDTTYLKQGGDQAFIDALAPEWSGALPATVVFDSRGRRVAFWEGAGDSARFAGALASAENPPPATEGTR